jgi:hypothetical protein
MHFKHLGVIDSKLTLHKHIDYITKNGIKLTMSLLRFAKVKFGLNERAIEIIYKGAFLPTVGYACPVFYKLFDRQFTISPLQSMQRLIELRMIRGYKTISTDAVKAIANLIPIDLYLKQRAAVYYVKKGIENGIRNYYFGSTGIDLTNVQKAFDLRNVLHFAFRKPIDIIHSLPEDRIRVYTDRSKSQRGVGSGFCVTSEEIPYKRAKFKLSIYCTVFQAEMFAIVKALEYLQNGNYNKTLKLC